MNILKVSAQDNDENNYSDYKVNVLDLEVTKDNNELKITFKLDNDLDLKNKNNDLKIYIANNTTNNKEILVTKDKSLNDYLFLKNITSISGEVLKLGKDDTLLDGVYTVILSNEEQQKLNSLGLENLIVKVEAIFNNNSSSVIGYLKKNNIIEDSNSGDVEESKDSLSIINSNNKDSDTSGNNTESTLPKTGIFLGNYLILEVGVLSVLLGCFLVRCKKIGS